MIVIGLTGGIGMGKSTVTRMFHRLGAAVSDADEVVHRLWDHDPNLAEWVRVHYPQCMDSDGKVDRKTLATMVFASPRGRRDLEELIHPLVEEEERRFVEDAKGRGFQVAVVEIPLLFETGAEKRVDLTITVTAPKEIQHDRVFARPRMDEITYQRILDRQLTDEERCARADVIIPTSCSEEETFAIVQAMWEQLQKELQTHGGTLHA